MSPAFINHDAVKLIRDLYNIDRGDGVLIDLKQGAFGVIVADYPDMDTGNHQYLVEFGSSESALEMVALIEVAHADLELGHRNNG